ncbi:glycosyltransferase family 39 protein [Bradyrhizobium diazoefficiens]|nr:glycosyltransferase family 39 protein [Bradyrhizobium diazoefficiens]MBR0968716.1 glycosyltransferase family 39 protein [Bradyrhizobium diazoefficiens]MBR0981983.1 glycosyltransferase family 39 protein [Bradyrhizobium diazoefficiens]MBR1011490.1 glycosyltransferase family 39 protein [Bradyrhizobium diazoefficiens]MBR1017914.1 glycosyltransferase family 39 protein [Bradyrhizobium diazoefficiens]MBR1055334.1 glycosyltransferase family 39 protein [Bradyrhizobium diazoefficiens]
MGGADARIVRNAALLILALVALRLVAAAVTPVTFDEAYYWLWSKHLAGGYYDHPPMVAYVIRAGTMMAGDTGFGVRVFSILLALPMSYAIYRAAAILFGGVRVAATSAILLNVTMMASVGTLIVTPDAPLLVASSFVLFFLAKVLDTGRGAWWLAAGAAVGAALLSKYTAMFFGPAILIWLAAVPKLRRWFLSPWPYLGGLVALAVFSPVILWNWDHQWVSFAKQLGRAKIEDFRPVFIAELIPTQIAFATPLVFILGAMGLHALTWRRAGALASRVLIETMFWTIVAYFIWHSLHARVEANWFAPVYPPFVVAAAAAASLVQWEPRARRLADFCLRWAAPAGIAMFAALIVQANTGWLSGYRRDATVRSVGVGWRELAAEIEAVRARTGATCVLAPDYGTTGWLAFYLPRGTCVVQQNQRIRWVNMPEPDQRLLAGKLLYVDELRPDGNPFLGDLFAQVTQVAQLQRRRGPLVIETYGIDLLEGAKGDVLDRSPPPEAR